LVREGAKVIVVDLPKSQGAEVASKLGSNAVFVPSDVRNQIRYRYRVYLNKSISGS